MLVPVKKCQSCQAILYASKYHCQACYSDQLESAQIEGKGIVYSFTKIHAAPKKFAGAAPYYVILVHLDAGLKVTGRFIGDDVEISTPVELADIRDGAYIFKSVHPV